MRVLDLYCGAGGFSKGFKMAGHEIAYGVDVWEQAVETYKKNFPEAEVLMKNVREIENIDETFEDVDIVIGSPPCQEFSYLRNGRVVIPDMREIAAFLLIVKKIKPKYWIMENVLGVLRYFHLNPYIVLNSSTYAIPQNRMRVFFGLVDYPKTYSIRVTVEDSLGIKGTLRSTFSEDNNCNSPNFKTDRPSRTVTTRPFYFIEEDRWLTVDEMRILQGFPDSFKFLGSKSSKYRMIGNAVPPLLSYEIAKSLGRKNEKVSNDSIL